MLSSSGFAPFPFQLQAWQAIHSEYSGLVNAPTGCGKTYSVFLGMLIHYINANPTTHTTNKVGLQLLWVTPLKALAADIQRAMTSVLSTLNLPWQVAVRNGDTTSADRQKQKRSIPQILIITPESLQLLIATKQHHIIFETLKLIAVDEWHELLGGKRGVQMELAISRLVTIKQRLKQPIMVWGISATIGNLTQAAEVLLSPILPATTNWAKTIVKASTKKKINVHSIIPDEVENYPWAGHLGLKLIDKVLPIIRASTTTLIFINTRGMTEAWYQALLIAAPDLAGSLAIHHGSMQQELRTWVEEALHTTSLKAVVCTASLDLGVDFRPVETIIQVGSPKGIARFVQRAGRSGHQPGAVSTIYFLPTHSLELLEAVALKNAITNHTIEGKEPLVLCYDVLIQYLCTLAVGDGFEAEKTYQEIIKTHCYSNLLYDDYKALLAYITYGGKALQAYDEYQKVVHNADTKLYQITNRRTAMHHRLAIGTIVSDVMLNVKYVSGGFIGVIEESFISKLLPQDVFTLAGQKLALVAVRDNTVTVTKSKAAKSIIPSYMGGRMSLTANLGQLLRQVLSTAISNPTQPELKALQTLLALQQSLSQVPQHNQLLIEHIQIKYDYHCFIYPFEGRLVHEAIATILAYRISQLTPITFSIAMNDYGFELLSDQPIPITTDNVKQLFSADNLFTHIQSSVNSTEMAKRKFRDIAVIGGMLFQGMPGQQKKARHLQNSASLLYKVLSEYEPNNLLLQQAYTEVFNNQMEEARLRSMLQRILTSEIIITHPTRLTPFCFPIKVESIRESMSSEQLADRVRRMQASL